MNKAQPDKWIRKAIYDAIDDIAVDGILIPCYDTVVTNDSNRDTPKNYVVMSTQTADVDKATKCEWLWRSTILLDIVTRFPRPGNSGSRLLADNILEAVKDATNDLVLDPSSGLEAIRQDISFPGDQYASSGDENIFRKFLRIELRIK